MVHDKTKVTSASLQCEPCDDISQNTQERKREKGYNVFKNQSCTDLESAKINLLVKETNYIG